MIPHNPKTWNLPKEPPSVNPRALVEPERELPRRRLSKTKEPQKGKIQEQDKPSVQGQMTFNPKMVRISTRVRRRFTSSERRRTALVRKLGACTECRRYKRRVWALFLNLQRSADLCAVHARSSWPSISRQWWTFDAQLRHNGGCLGFVPRSIWSCLLSCYICPFLWKGQSVQLALLLSFLMFHYSTDVSSCYMGLCNVDTFDLLLLFVFDTHESRQVPRFIAQETYSLWIG